MAQDLGSAPESRSSRSMPVVIVGGVAVIALLVGLSAVLRSRAEDASTVSRGASADRADATSIGLTVRNSLPITVKVAATDVNAYDYSGLAPNDPSAFAGVDLELAGSKGVLLGLNTNVSRGTFTFAVTSATGASLGSFEVGRGYTGYTCTSIKQGAVTVKDCSQTNVWWYDASAPKSTSSSCPSDSRKELGTFVDPTGATQKLVVLASCARTTAPDAGTVGTTTFSLTAEKVTTPTPN